VSEGGFSGVYHPHSPGVIVESANQVSDLAKGELRSWLEPWFQPRAGANNAVIASIGAVIVAPQTIPNGAALVVFNNTESHEDTTGTFTLDSGGIICNFTGVYLFSSFMAMQATNGNMVAMLRWGGQEFGRSYVPLGFGNISVTAAISVTAGARVNTLIYQDSGGNLPLNSARLVAFRL
jgi:hypothetical protein